MKVKGERMKRVMFVLIAALCTLAPQSATAKSDLGLQRLGGSLGVVSPENTDTALGLGLNADWGTFAPSWRLESHMEYWSKSQSVFGGGEASLHDFAVGARAKYFFSVSHSSVRPFAGGGLGLHFVHAEVSYPAMDLGGGLIVPATSVGDSSTKLGLDLGGGIETSLSPRTTLVADCWYGLVSDVNQFTARVGLSWAVGSR
jgi:opacity protein-like surface antigen